MKIKTVAVCPHCSNTVRFLMPLSEYRSGTIIIYCDPVEDGCKQRFIFDWELLIIGKERKIP
jgi:hypothetical protein